MDRMQQLERALVNAHRAGDQNAARALATEIQRMRAQSGTMPQQASAPSPMVPHGAVQDPTSGGYAMRSLTPEDPGILKSLALGAGRQVDRLIDGGRQAFNYLTGDQEDLDAIRAQQNANSAAFAGIERQRPISTAIGAGLTDAALTAPLTGGSSLLGAAARSAVAGAIPGAVGYGDFSDRMQRATGGAVGGAIGGTAGYGLSRLLTPIPGGGRVSDEALAAADAIGYRPTAGQITNSPFLQNVENYLARVPGTASKMQAIQQGNQTAVNRAAARAIGENADDLSESVMEAASRRIGGTLDEINARATPDLSSEQFLGALSRMDADNRAMDAFASPQVEELVDRGLELASKNGLSGEAYAKLRSALGSRAQQNLQGVNNDLGRAQKALQKALDEAAKESLSPEDKLALALARRQYGDWKALARGQVIKDGDVSPALLATALKTAHKDAFTKGTYSSGLKDLATLGRAIKAPTNPNSGSLTLMDRLNENLVTGLPLALGNRAAGAAYLSPAMQRYLTMQMLPASVEPALIKALAGGSVGAISAAQAADRQSRGF